MQNAKGSTGTLNCTWKYRGYKSMAALPLDAVEHDYPVEMLSAMSFAMETHCLRVLLTANTHF